MSGKSPAIERRDRSGTPKVRRARPTSEFPSGPDYVQLPGGLRNFAKSAVRALEVLDELAAVGRPLRAIEIGHALDLHASSADQILKTMVDAGYLLFDDRAKLYQPSPRFALFSNWFAQGPFAGLPELLDRVQSALGEATMICMRQGNDMQVALVKSRPGIPERVMPGLRFPLLASGAGMAALSGYEDAEIVAIVDRARRHRRDRGVLAEPILAKIAAARRAGYAASFHPRAHRTIIAIPLADVRLPGGSVLSVAVAGDATGARATAIAETVRSVM